MGQSGKSDHATISRGFQVALLGAALLFATEAQAQSALTHHVRQEVLRGEARRLNPLPATQSLRLDIVLPLRDQAGLDQFLRDLCDPSSPSYRHFLTVARVYRAVRSQPGRL